MVSTHLNITPEARKEVALYIMRSQHGGTREKNAALLHRSDAVPVQRVRLKGRSAWNAKIKPWRGCLFAHEEEQDVRRRKRARPTAEVQEGENVDQVEPLTCRPKAPRVASWSCLDLDLDLCADVPKQANVPTKKRGRQPARDNSSDRPSMMFQCPGCKHGAAAKRPSFQVLNLGTKTRCASCKKVTGVSLWTCPCGQLWHQCETHKHYPERLRSEPCAKNVAKVSREDTTEAVVIQI